MIFQSQDVDKTNINQYFGGLALRVPLLYGDFVFWGQGAGGSSLSVCLERKRLGPESNDLIDSLYSGRLVQQVRMARLQHQVLYLITEGIWRPGPNGLLQVLKGNYWLNTLPTVEYRDFDNRLNTLEWREGVRIKRTGSPAETAQVVIDLFHWWQKPMETHQSTNTFFESTPLVGRLSLVRRIAKELPGIGWKISGAVDAAFPSVLAMIEADIKQWIKIEGIGQKTAQVIHQAIRESHER